MHSAETGSDHTQKKTVGPSSHITCTKKKTALKWIHDLIIKAKTRHYKTPRRKDRVSLCDLILDSEY